MRRRMQKRQLKTLIETGHYRPEPERIACAMLRRRGVREFLTGGIPAGADGVGPRANLPLNPADRIQSSSAVPRQAA
jgi:hypothetical protein